MLGLGMFGLIGSVVFVAALVAAAAWAAFSSRPMSALGLVSLPVWLIASIAWWEHQPMEPDALAVLAIVIALFVAGMLVNQRIYQYFHMGALVVSMFLLPVFGALGTVWNWVLSILAGEITIPNWVWLVPLLLIIGALAWTYGRRRRRARQRRTRPATT